MKEENNTKNSPDRQKALAHLRNAKELFVIISMHTRMPFVFCDPETFDDEVLLYKTEEEAQKGGKLLLAQKDPVNIAKLENRHLLSFYSNLFTMGVNAMAINKGLEDETHLQLGELVKSRIMREKAEALLSGAQPGSEAVIRVNPRLMSQLVGQHGANRAYLIERFGLKRLRVKPDAGVSCIEMD